MGYIRQGVQGAPHRLPVLRIGRARLRGPRLRTLRLLRLAAARLRAGDLAGRNRPARRPGLPPLPVRTPRDAASARRDLPLPGLRLGGPSNRDHPRPKENAPRIGFGVGRRSTTTSGRRPYIVKRTRRRWVGEGAVGRGCRIVGRQPHGEVATMIPDPHPPLHPLDDAFLMAERYVLRE